MKFKEIFEGKNPKAPKNLPEGPVTEETYYNHHEYFNSLLVNEIKGWSSLADDLSKNPYIKKSKGKVKHIEDTFDVDEWDGDDAEGNLTSEIEIIGINDIHVSVTELCAGSTANWNVKNGKCSVTYDEGPTQTFWYLDGEEHGGDGLYTARDIADSISEL